MDYTTKMTKSLFTPSNLQRFFNIFEKQFSTFTNKLGQLHENEIMLQERILKCTFGTASETLMGVELESQTINQAIDSFNSYRKYWNYIILKKFWSLISVFNPFKIRSITQRVLRVRNDITNKIIEKNKSLLSELNTSDDESHDKEKESYFWKLYEELKDELDDNIITMLLGASDTTAVTMYFVLYMLANFPEIQTHNGTLVRGIPRDSLDVLRQSLECVFLGTLLTKYELIEDTDGIGFVIKQIWYQFFIKSFNSQNKVYEELSGIYDKTPLKFAPIQYEHLEHMKYLTRVIKETLRLFPAIPMIGRLLTQDLKIGQFILSKGANILIPIINVHRSEKYWTNPLMFDPDRFLDENINSSNYYIPFSKGRRDCVGKKYATMSMKVMLATLIRKFEFKIDKKIDISDIKVTVNVTTEPVNPIKIIIEKRNF